MKNNISLCLSLLIIIPLVVLVTIVINNEIKDFKKPLVEVCHKLGYTELTDYKQIKDSNNIYSSFYPETQYYLECDHEVLTRNNLSNWVDGRITFEIIDITKCLMYDKWGTCKQYSSDINYKLKEYNK